MREVPIVVKICPNDKKSDVKIVDVACGNNHVIAAGDDHSVYSWGLNTSGQLGLNDGKNINKQYVPTLIPSISFAQVYAKGHSSAGINAAGDLYTWGSGFKQRLMQNKEIEDENGNTPSPHRYSPTYVEDLFGNIVHSFAFSKTGSAALVMTRLYGVRTYLFYMYVEFQTYIFKL
jgi:alpha-tubulin suppressor-like RCC1 family protein